MIKFVFSSKSTEAIDAFLVLESFATDKDRYVFFNKTIEYNIFYIFILLNQYILLHI